MQQTSLNSQDIDSDFEWPANNEPVIVQTTSPIPQMMEGGILPKNFERNYQLRCIDEYWDFRFTFQVEELTTIHLYTRKPGPFGLFNCNVDFETVQYVERDEEDGRIGYFHRVATCQPGVVYVIGTYMQVQGQISDIKIVGGNGKTDPTDPGGGGATGKGVAINYEYNIRSWITNISSPHFSQKIYYNESNGSNSPQYNGNVSAIGWNKGGTTPNRSYNFAYDQLSQLKAAVYTGLGREQYGSSYNYDKHGNMLNLMRQGKTNNGADDYGIVDQLSFTYKGNQLKTITDAAMDVSIAESADFKGNATGNTHYTFNKNGAMTQDLNKGITEIQYNSLNLPQQMDILSPVAEARNEYLYSASGIKLKVTQRWNPNYSTNPIIGTGINESALDSMRVTDYVGNKIYENGELKKVLVDGGYYDYEKGEYFFYIQDHLGNNRVVISQNDNVVQRNDYYPFGMEFADNEGNDQPYKYNGKELDKMHGLNLYDYSARHYEPGIGRFTTVDPMAEKYYSISPYAYVANNPLIYIDPTGMVIDSASVADWNTRKEEILDLLANLNMGKNAFQKNKKRISSLLGTLNGLKTLEDSSDTYSLNQIDGEEGGITFQNGKIVISYLGTTANFIHEVIHGVQYENGDIGFLDNGTIGQDIFDEIAAYKAQYNFDPSSVIDLNSSSRIKNENDINSSWVQNITMSDGTKPYSLGGAARTGLITINSSSSKADFLIAYPRFNSFDLVNFRNVTIVRDYPGARFKR